MVYWRRQEELKMERFEGHFAKPNIEGILYIPYANVQGMTAGVETGECDFGGWWVQPLQVEQLQKSKHIKIINVKDHGYYHMNLNNRRKPFDDVAVRRALAYSTPKKMIVDRLLEGYGEVTHSIIPPANLYWHNPNVEKFEYDLEKAKKTLADAGYEWDKEGRIYYPVGKSDK